METIYADSIFLLNFIIDYLLLLASGKICAVRLHRRRIAAGAALGGLYSVLAAIPDFALLTCGVFKLASAVLMVTAAYGGEKRLFRSVVVFLCVSSAFGGAVWGAALLSGTAYGAGAIATVSMRTLLLSFAVCYAVLTLVFRRAAKRCERRILDIHISLCGKTVAIKALADTGNSLCDPISGAPVLVISASSAAALFPPEVSGALFSCDAAAVLRALDAFPAYSHRFRLIPYSAVGVASSLLPAFRPDSLTCGGTADGNTIVAISPNLIGADGDFDAVVSV